MKGEKKMEENVMIVPNEEIGVDELEENLTGEVEQQQAEENDELVAALRQGLGELFEDAINEGVRQAYQQGNLRMSVVNDPLNRVNSQDNTPAIVHIRLVPGNSITMTVIPQGAGSENASSLKMFHPSATREDIIRYVVSCVQENRGRSCTPLIIGVGIGGNTEMCTLLAKKALCRDLFTYNKKLFYTDMESEILDRVNRLGIGPEDMGGSVTALAVNIISYPTHVASLPVAVNLGCHVTRHATEVI